MANKKFTVGSLWQHGYATPEVKIIFVVVNDDGNYNIAVAICVDDSVNGSETLSYVPIDGGKLRPGSMFRFSSESFMRWIARKLYDTKSRFYLGVLHFQ